MSKPISRSLSWRSSLFQGTLMVALSGLVSSASTPSELVVAVQEDPKKDAQVATGPEPRAVVRQVSPEAKAVAAGVRGAVGGSDALDAIDALEFDFVIAAGDQEIRRHILFDRAGARLRIEVPTARGQVVVLLNVETDKGVALLDSVPVESKEQLGLQSYGRKLAENDLGWLLLPWRINDAGIYLGLLDDEKIGERACRVLEVIPSQQLPLPPGLRYVMHVDAQTFEPVRVAYVTEGMRKDQSPLVFDWGGWKTLGEARFCTEWVQVGGVQRIHVRNLTVVDAIDEKLFEGLPEQ